MKNLKNSVSRPFYALSILIAAATPGAAAIIPDTLGPWVTNPTSHAKAQCDQPAYADSDRRCTFVSSDGNYLGENLFSNAYGAHPELDEIWRYIQLQSGAPVLADPRDSLVEALRDADPDMRAEGYDSSLMGHDSGQCVQAYQVSVSVPAFKKVFPGLPLPVTEAEPAEPAVPGTHPAHEAKRVNFEFSPTVAWPFGFAFYSTDSTYQCGVESSLLTSEIVQLQIRKDLFRMCRTHHLRVASGFKPKIEGATLVLEITEKPVSSFTDCEDILWNDDAKTSIRASRAYLLK